MNKELFHLSDKVIIVTGSGRGLGKTMAAGLATFGAKVVICDLALEAAQQTAQAIQMADGKAMATAVDITSKQSCEDLLQFTLETYGRVDVLVNNAAIDIIKPFEQVTESDWDKILDVDLKGHFLCSQIVAKQLIKQDAGGSMINISSIASVAGIHGLAPYSAAKAGLNQLTRSMAVELAKYNIRVNAIAPGYFENIMVGATQEHAQAAKQKQIELLTPMGRRGKPEELVGAVIFLASEASSYITGIVLYVDGGYTSR